MSEFVRFLSGTSRGAVNTNVLTGYREEEREGTSVVHHSDAGVGDYFTVKEEGVYIVSVTSVYTDTGVAKENEIRVGNLPSPDNLTKDDNTRAITQGSSLSFENNAIWVGNITKDDILWIFSVGVLSSNADENQITIMKV